MMSSHQADTRVIFMAMHKFIYMKTKFENSVVLRHANRLIENIIVAFS